MKKRIGKQIIKNTIIYTLYIFLLEIIVKINTENNLIDWSTLRIFLSSLVLGIILGLIMSIFKKTTYKIIGTIITLGLSIYTWVEINLFNYLGFFMGVGNAEQGTKIIDYIKDYIQAAKFISLLVLVPFILYEIYIWFLDGFLKKRKLEKTTMFVFKRNTIGKRSFDLVTTFIILIGLGVLYYFSLDASFMQNKLQTIKNTSLIKMTDNSNLSVSSLGLYPYALSDLIVTTFNIEEDEIVIIADNNDNKNNEPEEVTDYTRIINDEAWNRLIENEKDSTNNKLNKYFINRDITDKNDFTGIFEGKNLIVVLMESVNMIAINEKEFPTLYKIYNEGISFRNNYTPRNNCSTGNNEMTVMTSLFTINNTCTANKYKNNVYPEAIFNIFNNAGYTTTSYHDYVEAYYSRRTIHPNMGSGKYYNANDLKMKVNGVYEEWPSDIDFVEKATPKFIDQDHFMAFMISVTTHQPYTVSSEFGDKHVKEFKDYNYSKAVKRYMSKMRELDKGLELLLQKLEDAGKLDDTVIALFADHYPYGLSTSQINEVLDYNVKVDKEVDRTPMVIYNHGMEPMQIEKYTTIIDLLPTLLNMFNLDYDPRLYLGTDIMSDNHGRAVFADGSWQDDRGYYSATSGKFKAKDGMEAYTSEELLAINQEITTRQKMSALAIKNNYFNYLGKGLKKYQAIIDEENIQVEEIEQEETIESEDN